ncbi:MAG: hypothetical protein GF320_10975, partial [Armatimonadia bacterium]|nr:hypothetical protein [Armatimonadia bacterium]
ATFRGMEPSQYDVEILQVLRGDGSTVDALLVRVSGPEIEAAGGIAAGMSGSPIYLDGELAAVLTYAIPDADPHYGYATPAVYLEPMLGGAPMQSVWLPPVGLPVGAGPRDPLSSLLWSGIAQAAPPRPAPADLRPGHAIGVQLARGDIHVTTYGTVSMVRGERALVFGHKFLHEGPCEYPLVRSDMGAIIPSETVPFAMGSPVGPPIGTVVEDRGAGLVVDLARTPQLVPTVVSVTRGDGASRELSLELVSTPEIFRETAASATIAGADGVLDRVGPGSATLTLSLHTAGGYVIERRDVLSSTRDIGGQCAAEVRSVLDAVFYGPLFAYRPARARISIEGSAEIRSARILGCEVAPDRSAPGGSALVTATLRPARASAVRTQATLEIPADLEPGSYLVRVHGKATDRVGTYDPWESPPAFRLPAEYCDWLSRSGRRSAIACDLVESPMDRMLAGDLAAVGFDDSGEMGTRDVPEGEDPPEPSPMAGLLGAGRVIERAFMETTWAVEGEAYGRLVVTP